MKGCSLTKKQKNKGDVELTLSQKLKEPFQNRTSRRIYKLALLSHTPDTLSSEFSYKCASCSIGLKDGIIMIAKTH